MHVLIAGMTSSGKTTLAKNLARSYRKRGIGVIVLDPMGDKWDADFQTDNPERFLKTAQQSRGCKLFIDESGEMIGRYNEHYFWLATRARHSGHQSHFITQRVVQLNKTCRDQCTHLFMFRVSTLDAKSLSIDWSCDELLQTSSLAKFHFLYTSRFGRPQRFVLTLNGAAFEYPSGKSNSGASGNLRTGVALN